MSRGLVLKKVIQRENVSGWTMQTITRSYPAGIFVEYSLGTCRSVSLHVIGRMGPAHIYLLDQHNYERFTTNQSTRHYGPGGVRHFIGCVQLPNAGPWWLVVENRGTSPNEIEVGFIPF